MIVNWRRHAIVIVITALVGCASTVRSGFDGREGYYEYVETHTLDKSTAYAQTLNWIARNYNSANNVIQLKDAENGAIVIKALAPFSVGGWTRYVEYTFETRVKDNKAKFVFTMTGLSGGAGFYAQPGWAPPKDEMPQLINQFVSIKNSIAMELNQSSIRDDF